MTGHTAPTATRWPARRLRLKHHVYFCDTSSGIQFDAGSRTLTIPGTSIYRLVERVIALMDQGADLATVQSALPERLQATVHRVVQALEENDMLLDETDSSPWIAQADPPAALREFVKYLQDRADPATRRQRWQAWRNGTVLLAGGGHALRAAARALADSGAGRLHVHLLAGHGTIGADELSGHLHAASVEGQHVRIVDAVPSDADIADAGLALWASDAPDATPQALCFEQLAASHGLPAIVALRQGGKALVAPPCEPGLPGLHELAAWDTDARPEPHSPASLALMGVVAAQAAMDHHFAVAPEQWQRQVRRISPYLEVSRHPLVDAGTRPAVLGSLRAQAPDAADGAVGVPVQRQLSAYERARVQLAPWFDPLFGPFSWRPTGTTGALLSQLPLYHDAIAVRGPRGDAAAARWVVGWGLNAEQAGTRALTSALEHLAARLTPEVPADKFTAAFDLQRWRARALAKALVADPRFETQRRVAWLDVAALQDPDIHLLRQLLHHFAPAAPRVLLHWHPAAPACVAQVWLDDAPLASAGDTTALGAVREALGLACSQLQMPDLERSQGPASRWAAPGDTQWHTPPADPSLAVAVDGLSVRWARADSPNLPANIHCGHAVVELPEVRL